MSELDDILLDSDLEKGQGDKAWHDERFGKFTSSEVYKLSKPKRGNADFTQTGLTYIMGKAYERVAQCSSDLFDGNKYTEWGEENELFAAHEFERITGKKYTPSGFVKYNDFIGGSPDGYLDDDAICEIKCPANGVNFVKLMDEVDPHHFMQMQTNLLVTGRKKCYYIIYDPRMPKGQQLFYRVIERDEEVITEIKERCECADRLCNEYVNRLTVENREL